MRENSFHFKGSRDYLHSTSVFDAVVNTSQNRPTDIDFVFNRRTKCNPVFSDERRNDPGQRLVGSWHDSNRELFIYEGDSPIADRVPYDEDAIAARCVVRDNTIRASLPLGGHSFIEVCVAAYKRLLQVHVGAARYAFARIILEAVPDANFEIAYRRKISGSFYQGDIVRSRPIGKIFFGVWQ